jgi:hypothetical protein
MAAWGFHPVDAEIAPENTKFPCIYPADQGMPGGDGFASDCLIRHTVFTCRDSPRGAPEIRACRAQFASLVAPETGEFEPHRENFGVLSLFRILLVPRETRAQVQSVHGRQIRAKLKITWPGKWSRRRSIGRKLAPLTWSALAWHRCQS